MKWQTEAFQRKLAAAEERFVRHWPGWKATARIDELRAAEYGRLDREHHLYLDYTGGGLYAESQLRAHAEMLARGVFGNPHSTNPTSAAMTELVERARRHVLEYFNAPEDEYLAIFTPNASGALKLVGESYPFGAGSRYLLTYDNHNSVNGIREFAKARGAVVDYLPVRYPEMRIDRAELTTRLRSGPRAAERLFAFPAQSNFSGVQHPLEIVAEAREAGWDVLLDAAAFAPTNRLDIARWRPDFACFSFYKMFGYPTGLGCLIMRKAMFSKLRRPWFAGGTIQIASVQANGHYFANDAAAFEDGTVDYLGIPAVEIGLRHLTDVGIDAIHERVRCLTGWLLDAMGALSHSNGRSLVQIHGPRGVDARGGTIAFNLLDRDGASVDIRRVQELGCESRISFRTGCFCNPGAGEIAFGLSREQIAHFFESAAGMSFDELRVQIRATYGIEIGAIRASVGLATTFADVFRFVDFLHAFADRTVAEIGTLTTDTADTGWLRDSA